MADGPAASRSTPEATITDDAVAIDTAHGAGSSPLMTLVVRRSDGGADVTVQVSAEESAVNVKRRVEEATGINVERQRLFFVGLHLADSLALASQGVRSTAFPLDLRVLDAPGG